MTYFRPSECGKPGLPRWWHWHRRRRASGRRQRQCSGRHRRQPQEHTRARQSTAARPNQRAREWHCALRAQSLRRGWRHLLLATCERWQSLLVVDGRVSDLGNVEETVAAVSTCSDRSDSHEVHRPVQARRRLGENETAHAEGGIVHSVRVRGIADDRLRGTVLAAPVSTPPGLDTVLKWLSAGIPLRVNETLTPSGSSQRSSTPCLLDDSSASHAPRTDGYACESVPK